MGFNSAFKGLKLLKNPGNGRLNNLNNPVLNVLTSVGLYFVDRNSSVGIATRYVLDGEGIERRWERNFPQLSRPTLGPTQPPIQCVPGLSRG